MSVKLKKLKGEFVRKKSSFRNWVTKNGRAGPSEKGGFTEELNE